MGLYVLLCTIIPFADVSKVKILILKIDTIQEKENHDDGVFSNVMYRTDLRAHAVLKTENNVTHHYYGSIVLTVVLIVVAPLFFVDVSIVSNPTHFQH